MVFKAVLKLSIVIAVFAALLQLEMFQETRNSLLAVVHQKFGGVLQSCPIHTVQNILTNIGLASLLSTQKPRSDTPESPETKTFSVIRYGKDQLYTKDELSRYVGEDDSLGLYLGILGRVYDVAKGHEYYSPGKGYAFFAGRDGTKAFMTGDFTEAGLIDEVTGLTLPQMLELETWIEFYEKTYTYKGKVIGNFYNKKGRPTKALLEAQQLIKDAHKEKQEAEDHRRRFPPCNSSWRKEQGAWVSCTEKSGGVKRDWAGVPRQYHKPGKEKPSCVCVKTSGPPHDDPSSSANRGDLDNPHLQEYEGCSPTADTCRVT